jgi:predicted metal-dependent TIM-barrel fold hydrolase
MTLGPIEVVTIGFESGQFRGEILPELERLVEAGVISIADGVFVQRASEDETTIVEFGQDAESSDIARVGALIGEALELVTDEDVEMLTSQLPVGASAAILVFEHTWVKPLRNAIADAGGELIDSIRVPGVVVQEVLDALQAEDEEN